MSSFSKSEEVWLKIYCASVSGGSARPDTLADVGLKKFNEKFPPQGAFCLSEELKNDIANNNTPGMVWGTTRVGQSYGALRETAKNLRKWLVERDTNEVLEYLANFDKDALVRMRERMDKAIELVNNKINSQ